MVIWIEGRGKWINLRYSLEIERLGFVEGCVEVGW